MKYWIVDNENERYEDLDDLCDRIFDPDNYDCEDDEFDDWINDQYDSVNIAGETFYAAEILNNCNDYLYNNLKSDYLRSRAEDDRDCYYTTLRDMEDGDREYLNDFTIECFEDDEDEEECDDWDETVNVEAQTNFFDMFQHLA